MLIQLKELDRAGDERCIDLAIDLDEISRREFQLERKSRQRIAQRLLERHVGEAPHGVEAALLQI